MMATYLVVRSLVHGAHIAQLTLLVPIAIGLLSASHPKDAHHRGDPLAS
jgi:hypothetical protein